MNEYSVFVHAGYSGPEEQSEDNFKYHRIYVMQAIGRHILFCHFSPAKKNYYLWHTHIVYAIVCVHIVLCSNASSNHLNSVEQFTWKNTRHAATPTHVASYINWAHKQN